MTIFKGYSVPIITHLGGKARTSHSVLGNSGSEELMIKITESEEIYVQFDSCSSDFKDNFPHYSFSHTFELVFDQQK